MKRYWKVSLINTRMCRSSSGCDGQPDIWSVRARDDDCLRIERGINMHKLTLVGRGGRYLCKKPLNVNVLTVREEIVWRARFGRTCLNMIMAVWRTFRPEFHFKIRTGLGRIYCVCSAAGHCDRPDSGPRAAFMGQTWPPHRRQRQTTQNSNQRGERGRENISCKCLCLQFINLTFHCLSVSERGSVWTYLASLNTASLPSLNYYAL